MDFSTDWLTHLIFPLINVTSSRDVCLFTNLSSYSACIMVLPSFCAPILSSQPCKWTICGRCTMASVRDINITEALLVLFLAYNVMKGLQHCWNWGIMAFMYRDMRHLIHRCIFCIFHNPMDILLAVTCIKIKLGLKTWEKYEKNPAEDIRMQSLWL